MEGGWVTQQVAIVNEMTIDIFNDDSVTAFIEAVAEFFEQRENNFIRDGYEWKIASFEVFT